MPAKVIRISGLAEEALREKLSALKELEVLVGIPESKKGRSNLRDESMDNVQIAFLNHYGSPLQNIPPRPFLPPAILENKTKIANRFQQAVRGVMEGDNKKAYMGLERTGKFASEAAKNFIGSYPLNGLDPNAPYTIKKKKFDFPYFETGQFMDSITYEIRKQIPQTTNVKKKSVTKYNSNGNASTTSTNVTGKVDIKQEAKD